MFGMKEPTSKSKSLTSANNKVMASIRRILEFRKESPPVPAATFMEGDYFETALAEMQDEEETSLTSSS